MKEQDIKKIFSIAADGAENGIESEEIKAAVLERLGKRAAEISENTDNEETVKPVFVTVSKNRRGRNIKIAAGAAAACLGISVLGVSLIGGNIGVTPPLSQNVNLTGKNIDTEKCAEIIGHTDNAGGISGANFKDLWTDAQDTFRFVLLDGSTVMNIVTNGEPEISVNGGTANLLLSEENGRLYFVKNAGEINIFNKEAAVKEDITDKISYDDFYIYSYKNPENTEHPTQYVIVGGSIEDYDYGYFELFKANGKWQSHDRFSHNPPAMARTYEEIKNTLGARWLINAFFELEKNYGEQIFGSYCGGGGQCANFKYVWTNQINENDLPPERPDVPKSDENTDKWLGEKSNFKNNTFTLKDGSTVVVEEKKVSHYTDHATANWLLREENGRIYYLGGDEPKDITDLIDEETPYMDFYENEESGLTHCIAIGGNVETGVYGYTEMFRLRERELGFNWEMNDCDATRDDEDFHFTTQKWFEKAANDFMALPEGGYNMLGGGSLTSFK